MPSLSSFVVSLLRTAVPAAWGAVLAFLLAHLPWIPHAAVVFLQSQETAVTGAVIVAWYALWRWLEKRLPAGLVRLVLGSAQSPLYFTPGPVPTVTVTTTPAPAGATSPANLAVVGEHGPEITNLPTGSVIPLKPTPPADPTPPAAA